VVAQEGGPPLDLGPEQIFRSGSTAACDPDRREDEGEKGRERSREDEPTGSHRSGEHATIFRNPFWARKYPLCARRKARASDPRSEEGRSDRKPEGFGGFHQI
jgi:hypothetical protein